MRKNIEIDTIAAQATAPGRAGVGIIRISGPKTQEIARQILASSSRGTHVSSSRGLTAGSRFPVLKPRYAHFAKFLDKNNNAIDEGLALYFPSPHSFTGEDVLELHGHGGPIVMDAVLSRILEMGARLANPGEFSERAFLNGKIDLAQAESIADLINASSREAAHSAMLSLQGEFSQQINSLLDKIINLRVYAEAVIDFSDQDIEYVSPEKIRLELENILQLVTDLQDNAKQGALLQEGVRVVIAGKPNVGKSSLLNYFCGKNAAIVTHIPGTTRDVLREYINIDGLPLHIIDTAGLRETFDIVEQEGIKRTKTEMAAADFILLITDEDKIDLQFFQDFLDKIIIVRNKIDLTSHKPKIEENKIYVSIKTGAGLNLLKDYLKDKIDFNSECEGVFAARRRHLAALEKGRLILSCCGDKKAFELLAEDLRLAHQALGEITGAFYPDDLLGKIFAEFCIGK